MGRDKTGKKQQSQELAANRKQVTADIGARDTALGGYGKTVDALEAQPGFSDADLGSMRAENAALIHGLYGDAGERLTRHAAATGHANDAGLYPQLDELTRQRALHTALGKHDIERINAERKLETRRMLPGLRFQPAAMYQGSASNFAGNNTALINQRMQSDSVRPLWADLAVAGIQAAGQAAGGYLGKPG
jgi:hypothetical protein